MERLYDDAELHMLRLGFEDEEEKERYKLEKVDVRKRMSHFNQKTRERSKLDHCYVCKKKISRFCKSHSIPKFVLEKIAQDGKVYAPLCGESPVVEDDYGVGKAGTFLFICQECDNKLFRDYENPKAHEELPTNRMLAQIAMKNYLQLIYKRHYELASFDLMGEYWPDNIEFAEEKNRINRMDLDEYIRAYERAARASKRERDDTYYLCYYKKLDYVVPVAAQAAVAMIADFEGATINDLFNTSKDYKVSEIHIAIFPLETTSVVMMFVDSENKRYRKFYRQLKKLVEQDQLAAINYIIFSYSENVFVAQEVLNEIKKDPTFLDVCQMTIDAVSPMIFGDPAPKAKEEFSLSKRHNIPNLLDEKYAIKRNEIVQ